MPAIAKIYDPAFQVDGARSDPDRVWLVVDRDPNRDFEYDDQPMPPDVAQALLDLIAPSNQGEVTE